ncbi:MAG: aspartate--tRNA ligase [Oligoflexales bacterium]|nr:aspartate--tRNA ligase [Oligoflexales bacterium]
MLRTNTCGELRRRDEGREVVLSGWVDRSRDLGQLFFISLRDRYGITQCVREIEDEGELTTKLKSLTNESVIQVFGKVIPRSEKDINHSQPTGEIEVAIRDISVLNIAAELPFQVRDSDKATQDNRLKYRYIDLRRAKMQHNLQIRHRTIQAVRDVFNEFGFLEIETPLLIRSTPEGARDFVVPSRLNPGRFYALPQSPQLYKQMLMVSGCDRYFQFASAFRDEDLRADRVPVHTQIDMEMSFVGEKDVFEVVEAYVHRVFKEIKNIDLKRPFPIMNYATAIEDYGSDKPDLRFGMKLRTVTQLARRTGFKVFEDAPCVRCVVAPDGDFFSRKKIDDLTKLASIYGAKGLAFVKIGKSELTGGAAKFFLELRQELLSETGAKEGDIVFFVADKYQTCSTALGQVRLAIARELSLIDKNSYEFSWINDFPLFEWSEERNAYDAMHHLFTKPREEDIPLLDSDPGRVRGQLYDLVLNGIELLSGSIRINNPLMQEKVLDIVKMPKEEAMSKFGFLMDSFRYGAPPHGGSAMGLDRLVSVLCDEESIREVIAYPCNNAGIFPLDGSPQPITDLQLRELQLKIDLRQK